MTIRKSSIAEGGFESKMFSFDQLWGDSFLQEFFLTDKQKAEGSGQTDVLVQIVMFIFEESYFSVKGFSPEAIVNLG